MGKQKQETYSGVNLLVDVLAIPYNLMSGFIVGAMVPVAAIAAIVAGIRLLTGKMPFLSPQGGEEERYLTLTLVAPEEAQERYAEQKEQIGGELGRLRTEIQSILQEARAETEEIVLEETEEALEGVEDVLES
jgi:signal transduction histidine kinase